MPVKKIEDLLISVDRLRQLTPMTDTTDENKLTPMIIVSTDVLTQRILGTKLTKKMVTEFNQDGGPTGIYLELYPYLEKCVVWETYKYCLPNLLFTISNGKISKGSSSDSQSIELNELAAMERRAAANVAMYENQVKDFLCGNQKDIPEIKSGANSLPAYLHKDLKKVNTAQGLSSTPNIKFDNF